MGVLLGWLDRVQRRSRATGFVIAVIYKIVDDQGTYLAAMITYYAFVSTFPLLLLLTTILAVVLVGHPGLQEQILHSALNQLPVIGDQFGQPRHLSGGTGGVVVGVAGAVYGALGAGQAIQNAMDTVWAVPRHVRPNPLRARLRSLLLLSVLGAALLATTLFTALGHASTGMGGSGKAVVVVVSLAVNTGVCLIAFRVGTAREISFGQHVPGALTAAVLWQLLQWFGAIYVGHVVKHASITNSIFAAVLGLMAFLYLVALTLVVCSEINVVRANRLYPRALLTPFTDDVDLTHGDRKTYAGQAKAQQAKGFERINVTFDGRSDNATR
jgi:YihY family inner membrane protein